MTSYSLKRNVSRQRSEHLISFDLRFGFSAIYPKNEVNFRISGIVSLDYAIQDDFKYNTYTHTFLSYQISFCLAYFEVILKQARQRKCRCLRTRGSRVPLQSWSEWEIPEVIELSKCRIENWFLSRQARLRNLLCKRAGFPLLCKHLWHVLSRTQQTNRPWILCYYNWLTFLVKNSW